MIKRNLEIGLVSLLANPLRSVLTMSGIIVGIAAVVAVLAIGKGQEARIRTEVEKMGENLIRITPQRLGPAIARDFPTFTSRPSQTQIEPLRLGDAEAIARTCPAIERVAPVATIYSRATINGVSVQVSVSGTTASYQSVRGYQLLVGRYLADEDLRQRSQVCVLEQSQGFPFLFGSNRYIDIIGLRFRVVGIVKPRSSLSTPVNTVALHVPITLLQERVTGNNEVQTIYCLARPGAMEDAQRQVQRVMTSRGGGKSRFNILTTKDFFEGAENMTRIATLVTAGIGALSLFVGGIGIMNILLASVMERTREIGLRKSVGARSKDILFQFLLESVAFAVSGGVLGICVGVVAASALTSLIGIPAVFSPEAMLVGIVFSLTVGIASGVYPAYKAAKLDPIEALRYE